MPSASFVDLLRCPRCFALLNHAPGTERLSCLACATVVPSVDGIPVLLPDPDDVLTEWSWALDDLVRAIEQARLDILADMVASRSMVASTRRRLEAHRRDLADHSARIEAIFTEAGVSRARRRGPAPEGAPPNGLLSYYQHLHRDWSWQTDEIEASVRAIEEVLEGRPLGCTLVLGAGACRLTRELHRRFGGTLTIALDINPLPLLVTRRMLAGSTVELLDWPASARDLESTAVLRRLGGGLEATDGVFLLFADGLAPPLAEGAFDTILTCWFRDQIPRDAAELVPVIHRLLAPGGTWLDHGPFIYSKDTPHARRYCAEEILELARAGGFRVGAHHQRPMPYMCSPLCNHATTEHVLTFAASRLDAVAEIVPTPRALDAIPRPPWLDRYQPPHALFGEVARLVDGRRSAAEIAASIARDHELPLGPMLLAVQACLRDIQRPP